MGLGLDLYFGIKIRVRVGVRAGVRVEVGSGLELGYEQLEFRLGLGPPGVMVKGILVLGNESLRLRLKS